MGSIFSQIMTMWDNRSYQRLLKFKNKTEGNHAFFRDNCASIWRKTLNRRFLEKMMKSYFFPKFQSVHVNWHKNQKLIVCWVGLLLSFGKIKSIDCHAFLEIKLVGFDLNLVALGVIYNFLHPLPGQFHYSFTQRGVLWDIHNGLQSENNNSRRRAKTESEAGHFKDSKENNY